MSLSPDKKGMSEKSIGMCKHDKTSRYSSSPSRKTKAYRAGTHTTGTRNAGMAAQNASMHSAQDHLDVCGVDEKGDVGDGDEQSPQDLDERGAPSRCRRR